MDALDLLARAQIHNDRDVSRVRAAYDAHRNIHPQSPTFASLRQDSWFDVIWGRVVTQLEMRGAARRCEAPLRQALAVVLDACHPPRTTLTFEDLSSLPPSTQQVAERLTKQVNEGQVLQTRSAEWIAARLWERRPPNDDQAALRWWVDRCRLLGLRSGTPTSWWSETDARAWRGAAFQILARDHGLLDWAQEQARADAQLAHNGRGATPPLPSGLINRWQWLNGLHFDFWERTFETTGEVQILVSMLCDDLLIADPAIEDPSSQQLFSLIVERPALLILLLICVRSHPS
ncbi:MAG: hypothetical protein R3B72_51615, partial [Polyangiaceae bacterium]